MLTIASSDVQDSETKKSHPWRRCLMGQHFVKEHVTHVEPSEKHPDGLVKFRKFYEVLQGE